MEKLNAKQKEAVKKMSTVRLVAKLAQAGIKEETLEPVGREQLMEAWAELVAAGKDVSLAPVTATAAATSSADVERERLEFEREKFRAEMAVREREIERLSAAQERESERLLAAQEQESARARVAQEHEAARLAWERSRAEDEREERRMQREEEAARSNQQLKLLQEANGLQREAIAKERSRSEAISSRLKTYGDALKNSITKMSDNPIELVVFFDSIERLFKELDVPQSLRVILLKPYLNERAAQERETERLCAAQDHEAVRLAWERSRAETNGKSDACSGK